MKKKNKGNFMKKKCLMTILITAMALSLSSCGQGKSDSESQTLDSSNSKESAGDTKKSDKDSSKTGTDSESAKADDQANSGTDADATENKVEIQVFIDSDLSYVMSKLSDAYSVNHPDVTITYNVDQSETLLTQIEEGQACDLYFSSIEQQMERLQNDKLIISDGYTNVVGNQLVVITKKGSGTAVSGIESLSSAGSIALATGNLSVGSYTRSAMVSLGMIQETNDLSAITSSEISEQLNGVLITDEDRVEKVLTAVADGSLEVGTAFYSNLCGYEDVLDVLEVVSNDDTGRILYPIAQIKNDQADEAEINAAKDFMDYVTSDEAATTFANCHFDTSVE